MDKFTKILSSAAGQVKELGGWALITEAGKEGVVLWVLGES